MFHLAIAAPQWGRKVLDPHVRSWQEAKPFRRDTCSSKDAQTIKERWIDLLEEKAPHHPGSHKLIQLGVLQLEKCQSEPLSAHPP